MSLQMFSFATDPETGEAVWAGNCSPVIAMQIIQGIVISEAIRLAQDGGQGDPKPEPASEEVAQEG